MMGVLRQYVYRFGNGVADGQGACRVEQSRQQHGAVHRNVGHDEYRGVEVLRQARHELMQHGGRAG